MIVPVWAQVRLGPARARARLDAAAREHVFEAPPGPARLLWIAVSTDGALHPDDRPGSCAVLPVPNGTFVPKRPERGEICHRADARRYAPYWVFGVGDDVAIVDAVEGKLGGSLPVEPRAGARFLIGLTLALLFVVVIGLEIIEPLITLGLLLPLRFVLIDSTGVMASLVTILAALGALSWFGRRTLSVTGPLLAEAGSRARTHRVELARLYARPTVTWAVGWLVLFVALRLLITVVTEDLTALATGFSVLAAGICGLVWRVAARTGTRPSHASPWAEVASEANAPPLLHWAHLTVRIALFGVSAWMVGRLVSSSELARHMGLWVLDIGPGVHDHVVAAGVALGMWPGERRFRAHPAKNPEGAEASDAADRPPGVEAAAQGAPDVSAAPPMAIPVAAPAYIPRALAPEATARAPISLQPPPETSPGAADRADAGLPLAPIRAEERLLVPGISTDTPHAPILGQAADPRPRVPSTRFASLSAPMPKDAPALEDAPKHVLNPDDAQRIAQPPRLGGAPIAVAAAGRGNVLARSPEAGQAAAAAAPRAQISVKVLLAALLGAQLGAIIAPWLAVIGLGGGAWIALWARRARSGLSKTERWAAWGAMIAGASIGQWIGTAVGTLLMGVMGAEAGAEIGEWTMASAALAALIHGFNSEAPPADHSAASFTPPAAPSPRP